MLCFTLAVVPHSLVAPHLNYDREMHIDARDYLKPARAPRSPAVGNVCCAFEIP